MKALNILFYGTILSIGINCYGMEGTLKKKETGVSFEQLLHDASNQRSSKNLFSGEQALMRPEEALKKDLDTFFDNLVLPSDPEYKLLTTLTLNEGEHYKLASLWKNFVGGRFSSITKEEEANKLVLAALLLKTQQDPQEFTKSSLPTEINEFLKYATDRHLLTSHLKDPVSQEVQLWENLDFFKAYNQNKNNSLLKKTLETTLNSYAQKSASLEEHDLKEKDKTIEDLQKKIESAQQERKDLIEQNKKTKNDMRYLSLQIATIEADIHNNAQYLRLAEQQKKQKIAELTQQEKNKSEEKQQKEKEWNAFKANNKNTQNDEYKAKEAEYIKNSNNLKQDLSKLKTEISKETTEINQMIALLPKATTEGTAWGNFARAWGLQ